MRTGSQWRTKERSCLHWRKSFRRKWKSVDWFAKWLLLYYSVMLSHFLDPPGNHPHGAIFPTVDWINQSSVDFHAKLWLFHRKKGHYPSGRHRKKRTSFSWAIHPVSLHRMQSQRSKLRLPLSKNRRCLFYHIHTAVTDHPCDFPWNWTSFCRIRDGLCRFLWSFLASSWNRDEKRYHFRAE